MNFDLVFEPTLYTNNPLKTVSSISINDIVYTIIANIIKKEKKILIAINQKYKKRGPYDDYNNRDLHNNFHQINKKINFITKNLFEKDIL